MTTNTIGVSCEWVRRNNDKPEGPVEVKVNPLFLEFLTPLGWWEWNGTDMATQSFGPGGERVNVHAICVYCHQDMNGVQSWYAFPNLKARALHQELMKVEGVGAKGALMLMAKNSPKEIYTLLDNGDRAGFACLKGMAGKVGTKVIEHLFKEVKIKGSPMSIKLNEDAVMAVTALGYKIPEAKILVGRAMQALPQGSTEAIIAAALKK